MSLIKTVNLVKTFGNRKVLRGVNFSAESRRDCFLDRHERRGKNNLPAHPFHPFPG